MEILIGILAFIGIGLFAIFVKGGGPYPSKGSDVSRRKIIIFWLILSAALIGIYIFGYLLEK
jgi:hypothetical protein